MNLVFYDTETTGTDTTYDQILQFGAIKTDHDLNELDRFEIRCRLLPYVVPSPGALLITGVSIQKLTDPALPSHYEMIRAIRAKLTEWSPAIFIGHNSLNFDEHLLRQAFYKTLHAPYLTNSNGNGRTDSLRMILAAEHYAPGTLTVPLNEKGKPSFKLEGIAQANGFDHSNAHDAMADAEATIHLCRLLSARVPSHWQSFIRHAQKSAANNLIADNRIIVLTDIMYAKSYSRVVTRIGVSPENSSEVLVFDLSVDPKELIDLTEEELAERLGESPKPVRSLKTNSGPIVIPYEDAPEHICPDSLTGKEAAERADCIEKTPGFMGRLLRAFGRVREEREKKEPAVYVEEKIYEGFASREDQKLMDRFHELEWPARPALLERLSDERYRQLGQRLIYSEAPDALSGETRREYEAAIARRLMGVEEDVPWLTYPKAIEEVADLSKGMDGSDGSQLIEIKEYLERSAEIAAEKLD